MIDSEGLLGCLTFRMSGVAVIICNSRSNEVSSDCQRRTFRMSGVPVIICNSKQANLLI